MTSKEEVEDDGVSFGSDITIEAEDETVAVETPDIDVRRAHWSPDVVDRRASSNNDFENVGGIEGDSGEGGSTTEEKLWLKIGKIVLVLLPSLMLTCVLQFIDLMVGMSFYLIGLVVFQGIFWPSLGYIVYSQFVGGTNILETITNFRGGHWVNLLMLQVHGIVMGVNVLLLVLSIQNLDITVALALTFLPCLVILLLEHILVYKSCSLELLVTLVFAYSGVIIVTIPGLLTEHPIIERYYYNGIAAAIGSGFLTIQGSFILKYLKYRNIDESLITSSIGLQGTLICVIIGAPLQVLGPVKPINAGFISAIVVLMVGATILGVTKLPRLKSQRICINLKTGAQASEAQRERASELNNINYTSMNRLRAIVFLFSCLWALCKQFYRHTLPSVFSVVGVTLIIGSFLFAMGYREWHIITSEDVVEELPEPENNSETMPKNIPRKKPFQFIPWLFSREPILYIH